jgi:urease accessory protein
MGLDETHARLLDLLQLADSSFPSGSYAYSAGLETLYGEGEVDLEVHLRFLLVNSLGRVELPVVRLAFGDEELRELDLLMDVLLPVREVREASRSVGRSLLRAVSRVRRTDVQAEHHAVVFGAVWREWELELNDGLSVYAFQALRQQLSAAQRLGKIGQSTVQELLHSLKGAVIAAVAASDGVRRDEIGGFSPRLDLAGMSHATQAARLFRS